MHNLLLLNADKRLFEIEEIERIFHSDSGFRGVRFNDPGGAAIEADFVEPEGRTIVGLSGDHNRISLSGTSDTAFRAAMILQQHLERPLRIFDTEYSFDLILRDFPDLEALRAAVDEAQAR